VFVRSHDSSEPGGIRSVAAPRGGGFAALRGQNRLHFSAAIEYELIKTDDPELGPWKVRTDGYWYHVVSDAKDEVLLFHWHPDRNSTEQAPHLHLGTSQLTREAVVTRRTHVPTGRVSLESVIRLLITDFGVVPLRSDWDQLLDANERRFLQHRTWSGRPPTEQRSAGHPIVPRPRDR
jgi:hypothetical protein